MAGSASDDADPDQQLGALAGGDADDDRDEHRADARHRGHDPHPARGEPAVEERRTEPVADAAEDRPGEVGAGGGAAREEDDHQHRRRTAELGDQRDRPGAAAAREHAAVEVAQAVRRRREQREQDAHVATTPATQTRVASSAAPSSITMLRPTACSECTVEGQASAEPTRSSSAR